jgi:K+-sensing histidine kinase KdpD
MNINSKAKVILKKLGLGLLFLTAICVITRIALQFQDFFNPTTVGFSFLIVVVLSAVFAGLAVAISIAVIATLLFNYFFFPPIGTLRIYDFHNWVAVFALFFTAIVISRLTASAHENARRRELLDTSLKQLREFSSWLSQVHHDFVTLSEIAEGAVKNFLLKYCSIHVYAEGKWHHFSGTSIGELSQHVADILKSNQDHPTNILELAEEQGLGVRYSQIRTGNESFAVIAIKGDLPQEAFDTFASMIGLLLAEILRETDLSTTANTR